MRRFALVLMPLLILALAIGASGCYWGEEGTLQHDLRVTLDDACFTEESTSSEYSEALLVTLSFENVGKSALYFDYSDFVYIAGDTDLFTPGSRWCQSCPPVVNSIASMTRVRALKPRQTCSCQFEFTAGDDSRLPRDERLTLVIYGEDATGESAVVELKLPPLDDMRRCTEDDLAEDT